METKIENPDEVIHLWNRSLIYKSASLYRGRVGGRGGLSVKKSQFQVRDRETERTVLLHLPFS